MNVENNSEVIEGDSEQVVETQEIESGEGLSRRDALEVSIEALRDLAEESPAEKTETVSRETKPEVKPAESTAPQALEAPVEYSREEREWFKSLPREGQEIQLRLDKSRQVKLDEIRERSGKVKWLEETVKHVEPFVKITDSNKPVAEQIITAVKLVNAIHADRRQAALDILEGGGIKLPDEVKKQLLPGNVESPESQQIKSLQDRLNRIETEKVQTDNAVIGQVIERAWGAFASTTNGSGAPKYPSILGNSEEATRLTREIGSLVTGDTPLAVAFVEKQRSLNPNVTPHEMFEAAYRFVNGKIDDSASATKPEDSQKHLKNSNQASASVPGRGSSGTSFSVPRKLNRRETLGLVYKDLTQGG